MENESRRNQGEIVSQWEHQNDLFGNPPPRWERYKIARKHFRDESPKEVFFERESNEVNYGEGGDKLREQVANTLRTNYSNGFSNETYVEARFDGRDGRKTIKAGRTPEIKITTRDLTDESSKTFPTIRSGGDGGVPSQRIMSNMRIRRLTPIETEALMSWPRDWTRWGINEKGEKVEISDSRRYKMCGNGVVSNCVRALIEHLL